MPLTERDRDAYRRKRANDDYLAQALRDGRFNKVQVITRVPWTAPLGGWIEARYLDLLEWRARRRVRRGGR